MTTHHAQGAANAPPNDESRSTVGAAPGFKVQTSIDSSDCAAPPTARQAHLDGARSCIVTSNALKQRSTRTAAQRQRILSMLAHGERTTFDLRRAGIMQSSTRIHELRKLGHPIVTVARRDLFDAEGYRHERVAVYALMP